MAQQQFDFLDTDRLRAVIRAACLSTRLERLALALLDLWDTAPERDRDACRETRVLAVRAKRAAIARQLGVGERAATKDYLSLLPSLGVTRTEHRGRGRRPTYYLDFDTLSALDEKTRTKGRTKTRTKGRTKGGTPLAPINTQESSSANNSHALTDSRVGLSREGGPGGGTAFTLTVDRRYHLETAAGRRELVQAILATGLIGRDEVRELYAWLGWLRRVSTHDGRPGPERIAHAGKYLNWACNNPAGVLRTGEWRERIEAVDRRAAELYAAEAG